MSNETHVLSAASSSKNRCNFRRGCLPMFLFLLTCILVSMASGHEGQKADDIEIKPSCTERQNCPVQFEDAELKKRLSELEYHVTQEKGTESAFSGKFWKLKDEGLYSCVVCNHPLFYSSSKFLSGCGWPSFSETIDKASVTYTRDTSYDMDRIEVTCSQCGAHLGHLFYDGPTETKKRYCMNSVSLSFTPISRLSDDQKQAAAKHGVLPNQDKQKEEL